MESDSKVLNALNNIKTFRGTYEIILKGKNITVFTISNGIDLTSTYVFCELWEKQEKL